VLIAEHARRPGLIICGVEFFEGDCPAAKRLRARDTYEGRALHPPHPSAWLKTKNPAFERRKSHCPFLSLVEVVEDRAPR
jgi:hypothetical protein